MPKKLPSRLAHIPLRALQRINDVLPELYALRTEREWLQNAVSQMHRIVDCDLVSFNEFNGEAVPRQLAWPEKINHLKSELMLAQHMHEHPIVNYARATGDTVPLRISDFLTRRRFHNLGLYKEFYRHFEVEAQVAFELKVSKRQLIGVALMRSRGDFHASECALLLALQPHFLRAWRNSKSYARMLGRCGALEELTQQNDRAVLLAHHDGRIEWLNEAAERVLRQCIGPLGTKLPDAFRRPTHASNSKGACQEYRVDLGRGVLLVREVSQGRCRLLTLHELAVRIDRRTVQAFSLTRREGEILDWVALGKTNAEIAAIVGSKTLTVKKHLEHVYAKLGVSSRTAAITLLLRGETPAGAVSALSPPKTARYSN